MQTTLRFGGVFLVALFGSVLAVQSGDKAKDSTFVQKASEGNLGEIEISKMVAKQTTNAKVREFANKLAEGHTKANQELSGIANKLNITVANEISKHCREMKEKLSKSSGADLDREFIAAQVKGHEEALQMYKDQAKNGQNADLKAFANKVVPTIEEHLRQARDLSKTLDKN